MTTESEAVIPVPLPETPADANAACPGTSSSAAGQSSACAGCPNQSICQTAPKGPDPDVALIAERLQNVRRKILILSGKGGCGKSTLTAQLGFALASDEEKQVCVVVYEWV